MINSIMDIDVATLLWLSQKYLEFSRQEEDPATKLTFAQIATIAINEAESIHVQQEFFKLVGE